MTMWVAVGFKYEKRISLWDVRSADCLPTFPKRVYRHIINNLVKHGPNCIIMHLHIDN